MPTLTKKQELETRLNQVNSLRKACSSEAIQLFDILNKLELLRAGHLRTKDGKVLTSFEFRVASGTVTAVNNRGQLSMVRTTKQGPVPFSQLEMSLEIKEISLKYKQLEEEVSEILGQYQEVLKDFESKVTDLERVQELDKERKLFESEMVTIRRENITTNERLIQERLLFDRMLKRENAFKRLSSKIGIYTLLISLFVSISYNIMSVLHIV